MPIIYCIAGAADLADLVLIIFYQGYGAISIACKHDWGKKEGGRE
jgi:hypothetical protein